MRFGTALLGLIVCLGPRTATPADGPYRDFSGQGAGFHGPGRQDEAPDTLTAVRLGLVGPAQGLAGQDLRQGVELALAEANRTGGYRGLPYELVFRPDDGPWGVVAHQVVRLAYEDQVWAVIAGLDGERAHAAELVSAKAWVPVLTPGAADLSLDYANVPWLFRCLPDDLSQAQLLLRAAAERGWQGLVVVSEGVRDARIGLARLQQAAREQHFDLFMHLEYDPRDPLAVLPRLRQVAADALLVWGRPATALPLISRLRKEGVVVPVLVPTLLALPEVADRGDELGEVVVAAPVDLSSPDSSFQAFRQDWIRRTGREPSYVALFAYDTTRLLLAAIQQAGLNRVRIRDALAGSSFRGLTGPFSFNSLGGRQEQPVLMELCQRRWVLYR